MLYKTKVDYTSEDTGDQLNDYAMNHVLGCSHGCKYPCYAFSNAKRFGQVSSYEDWCEPKLVSNALKLLDRELASKKDVRRVHMCFTTDPFPFARIPDMHDLEAWKDPRVIGFVNDMAMVHDYSLAAAMRINAAGIPITFLTKGVLPEYCSGAGGREERLCSKISSRYACFHPHPDNYYGISLVSLNERFREEWEPNTAPYAERIASLRALHDAGLKTWVSMEPFPALSWEYELVHYGDHAGRIWHELGFNDVYPFPKFSVREYGLTPETVPAWEFIAQFGNLALCLEAISFVDRIVFGRWNYNKSMPTDVGDVDAWYRGAAEVVRRFCKVRGIECVIKEGVE